MSVETHNAKLLSYEGWVCRRISNKWSSKGTREKYSYHYHQAGMNRTLCGVSVLLEKPTESTAITLPSSKPEDHEPCKRCLALMMRSTGEVAHA